jgi:hypothetical protein
MSEVATTTGPRYKALPPPAAPERPATPYKGLVPFAEADAPFFFGRDDERLIIAANLRSSSLTILYGGSGTGKSSVLRAGVIPDLRRTMSQNLETRGAPGYAVAAFSSWRDDPAAGLARAIEDALDEVVEGRASSNAGALSVLLSEAGEQVEGKLLVILDQFEEYFLYHAGEPDQGSFAEAFIDAVNDNDVRVNFLVSLREDALAKLDAFQGEIPKLFDNYLRIEHLDTDAARSAIIEPVARWNGLAPDEDGVVVEDELVEAVVEELQTGRVHVGGGLGETLDATSAAPRIETPYLQLVMTRLWDEERRSGSRALRRATLERLGGAERIVATHLDEVLSVLSPEERHLAANVFHYLVTPSGTKIAHSPADLAAYVDVPEPELRPVLQRLADGDVRILRPVPRPFGEAGEPRFEIFHDVLAAVILDWRSRYVKDRELADGVRMGIAIAVHGAVLFFLLFVTLGFVVLAFSESPLNLLGLMWTGSALAAWAIAARTLRRRWARREGRLLLGLLKTELAVLTAPLSFFVTVPLWLVRRRRARRNAAAAA